MSAKGEMNELEERKRLLVLQSDLHRTLLAAEWENVRSRFGWLNEAGEKARTAGPWLGLGAAAVGLVAAWRGRKLARFVPAAVSLWSWIQRLRK